MTYNAWERKLRWAYNIDADEFFRILALQGGTCAMCPRTLNLRVDHNHACCPGERSCGLCIRGILCSAHNTMLGLAKDNVDTLALAIVYIQGGLSKGPIRITTNPSTPKQRKPSIPRKSHMPIEKVRAIRASDMSTREAAKYFNVSIGTISDIRTRKTWSTVED